MLLRTGKTPSGAEAAGHIRRLVRHIRQHWPATHITVRGDGHYGRPEVMAFCEAHGIDYVFGLPTNAALRANPDIVAAAEFATLRLRLLKVAARVIETATRIRIAFASACPEASTFRAIAAAFRPAPT